MRLAFAWGLLLCLPLAAAVLAAWRRRPPAVLVPDLGSLPRSPRPSWRHRLPLVLEALGCLLLVIAMCRPQWLQTVAHEQREAVDVMLVLDVSGSMDAVDLPAGLEPERAEGLPSRLACARRELDRLMQARPGDRFGLVVFARRPYPACPLTFDHEVLRSRLAALSAELLDDGTGLTAAIALAVVQARTSSSPHRIMVLLTDGRDNVPAPCSPEESAELAAAQGVTVHVVGIGTGRAVLPVSTLAGKQFRPVDSAIEEARLKAISEAGRGVFVHAADPDSFARAIDRIAATEKGRSLRPPQRRHRELFPLFALAGLGALAGAFLLGRSNQAVLL